MSVLEKLNQFIARFEEYFLIIITLGMVILAFLQVVLRNAFDHGLLWADPLLRHMVLWVGFIGASLATRDKKHISIDVFGRLLKGRWAHINQLAVNIFAFIITLLLTHASWRFVIDEKEFGTIIFGETPAWFFQIIIPIGFGLICLRFFILTIQSIAELIKGEEAAL